ncbi:MAG: cyclic nucleotide-binding domain-containing protein [Clostridia bacterium]|nr:cyclic nucleotide-binding domain-containing protein [Clostridia bacterium]
MEIPNDPKLLKHYIDKYHIAEVFQKDMTEHMRLYSFNKGEFIFRANEKIDQLYFMVEGKAKVYTAMQNGKSLLLRFYNPFVVIGDVEFIEKTPITCNVEVISTAVCIGIPLTSLERHAISDPAFLTFICRSLGEKLAKNSVSSAINLLYPLENRLASYLLAIASLDENSPSFNGIFTDKLTEMADLLGTSYRHLLRTLNKLASEGIIEKQNNKIMLLDRYSLEKLAGDLYN